MCHDVYPTAPVALVWSTREPMPQELPEHLLCAKGHPDRALGLLSLGQALPTGGRDHTCARKLVRNSGEIFLPISREKIQQVAYQIFIIMKSVGHTGSKKDKP
ncbi:unnamed protein product [Nesidiocoris tenuis]|uniref:Uncharacterized protein n=1 Tax=Nesidiocoris tenuis TaxID=355587 RepID=A0A6H5G7I1_9HEMI|nr:unnamed protein product [Nesidiocoris tenuis]